MKVFNFSKRKHGVRFHNEEFKIAGLDLKNLSYIAIGPGVSLSSSDVSKLISAGVCVCFEQRGAVSAFHRMHRKHPRLKLSQYRITTHQKLKNKVAKTMIKRRMDLLKLEGFKVTLPLYKFNNNVMLTEALMMKEIYRQATNGRGRDWLFKNTEYGLMMHWLYSMVESVCCMMGVDPDLGVIHSCAGGFIYDIADVFKPLFLKPAIQLKKASFSDAFKVFWQVFRSHGLRKKIPSLIKSVLTDT